MYLYMYLSALRWRGGTRLFYRSSLAAKVR